MDNFSKDFETDINTEHEYHCNTLHTKSTGFTPLMLMIISDII